MIQITENELKTLITTIIESVKKQKKNSINEIFGLSGKEKLEKQLKMKILQAFSEINKFNFNSLFYQPGTNNSREVTMNGLEIRVRQAGEDLPTVRELIPELFNEKIIAISVKYRLPDGKVIDGLIPNLFGSIYDNNHFIVDETGKYYAKLELHKKFPNIIKYFNGNFIMDNKQLD